MSAQLPNDEEVLQYIESIPNLRTEWGITGSKKMATITFVLLNILLVVVIIGTIVYFMLDGQQASHNVSGLLIVLVLAYAVSGLRHFQLRAERAELPKYRKALARELAATPRRTPRRRRGSSGTSNGSPCATAILRACSASRDSSSS